MGIVIDGEGDSTAHECRIHGRLLAAKLIGAHFTEGFLDPAIVRPTEAAVGKHLIEKVFRLVLMEKHGGRVPEVGLRLQKQD